MTDSKKLTTYADAGVDIDAGNKLVDKIKPIAAATKRLGASGELGGFGGLFDLKAIGYNDPILVSATDGVGTKLNIAFYIEKHDTIGIDLVAMCVNDLIVQGAEPLFFLDYFATGKLKIGVAEDVIKGIAEGCKLSNSALVGGETAEMPGMYPENHYDLAGFSVGAVERDKILPSNDVQAGDIVIGLKSSGVHSNGFSLVRHVLKTNSISFDDISPFAENKSVGEVLLEPTKIYVKSCLAAIKTDKVKALAHITGGGLLENIPRILPDNLAVKIDLNAWEMSNIFKWIAELGNIEENEMLRTFNCGMGMTLIVDKNNADEIVTILKNNGEEVAVIGEVTENSGQQVTFYR
jgi:phosphoribosylformylglycinamidine cyclo-ligase